MIRKKGNNKQRSAVGSRSVDRIFAGVRSPESRLVVISTTARTRGDRFGRPPISLCPDSKATEQRSTYFRARNCKSINTPSTPPSLPSPLTRIIGSVAYHCLFLTILPLFLFLWRTFHVSLTCGDSTGCLPLKHHLEEGGSRVEGGAHEDCNKKELYHWIAFLIHSMDLEISYPRQKGRANILLFPPERQGTNLPWTAFLTAILIHQKEDDPPASF